MRLLSEITDCLTRDMNWNNEIDKIYNLATLHSWITQIDQMLEDFLNKYESNADIIKFLISKLKEKNVPTEHYIISLVVLNYFKYPTEEIIEYANESLYGKISKNDIQFFKKHLFSGNFPLSDDLSYDITNRSFLSPKKAIAKAMNINSVISKENPILTVLYMNFILSRIDMNEENRAMVAFLLLRVDLDLPEGLKERVYKYLWEYRDIIKELLEEENGEPVNIDDIERVKEKISSLEIREISADEKNAITAQNAADDYKMPIADPVDNSISEIFRNEIRLPDSKKFPQNANGLFPNGNQKGMEKISGGQSYTGSDQPDSSLGIPEIEHDNFRFNPKENSHSKASKKDATLNSQGYSENRKAKGLKATPDNESKIAYTGKSAAGYVLREDKSVSGEEKKEKNWKIFLRKNREILESILYGAPKGRKEQTLPGKKKDLNIKEMDQEIRVQSSGGKKRKAYFGLLAVLFLSALLVILARNTNKETQGISLNPEYSGIIPDQGKEVVPAGPLADITETGLSEKPLPKDFPFNFTVDGSNLIWKVVEGDSITGFFYALQNFKDQLKGTKLENISKMEWGDFYNNFVKNNPSRTSYHIIYPAEVFLLSLE